MGMRIAIIGATGSIGTQALDVVSEHPERFTVVALAAGSESERFSTLRSAHPHAHAITGGSRQDLVALVEASAPDLVLVASAGLVALPATLAALRGGAAVAIANKETIVCAGELIMPLARAHGVEIRPERLGLVDLRDLLGRRPGNRGPRIQDEQRDEPRGIQRNQKNDG